MGGGEGGKTLKLIICRVFGGGPFPKCIRHNDLTSDNNLVEFYKEVLTRREKVREDGEKEEKEEKRRRKGQGAGAGEQVTVGEPSLKISAIVHLIVEGNQNEGFSEML